MKKHYNPAYVGEFLGITRDILSSPAFFGMKAVRSHINSTLYRHSAKVAYLCFLHYKRKGADAATLAEVTRAALLHDYYLYDRHKKGSHHKHHWRRHSRIALENAERDYPGLTARQRDMITHHMFPVTLCPPLCRAGWVLCLCDKRAALDDRFGKKRYKEAPTREEKRVDTTPAHMV